MGTEELERSWIEQDRLHMIHGTTPLDVFVEKGSEMIIDRAEGLRIWDTAGREYIDGLSGLVCVNIGYGRPEMARAATDQIQKLSYTPNSGGFTSTAAIEYSSKLSQFLPKGLDRVFLANSGSEANETAYKMARFFWANQGKESKYKIISRDMGYHGLNLATTWATGMPALHNKIGPPLPGFLSIPACYCYRCPLDRTYPGCQLDCAEALAEIIEREEPDTVAAFVAEPVYGSAGTIVPPPEYFPKIREICDRYDILLVLDEIVTGFGRTGKNFGCQHWDILPDMMCLSKGIISAYLPFSAVALSHWVFEGMLGPDGFPHLYTCGGHPVVCAVAQKNLEIIIEENLVENAARMGTYMLGRLEGLERSPHVGHVHGLGLLLGIDMVQDKKTKEPFPAEQMKRLVRMVRERGVVLRDCETILAIAPPLIIQERDADRICDAIEGSLADL